MENHTSLFLLVLMMKLQVKVIPGAKKSLCKEEGGILKIYLTALPLEGRANEALIDFLAKHYGVKRSTIEIVKGLKSRHKVVNILGI
jgi:uncharacterized protein